MKDRSSQERDGKLASTKGHTRDWIRRTHDPVGLERVEAFFQGHGYAPHRHDTYAIGVTLAGVQSFKFRNARRYSLPGRVMVIHPDELHDGEAETSDGFLYRIAYIDPALLQAVLGGAGLPFFKHGITEDARLHRAVHALLSDIDSHCDLLERDDLLVDVAVGLQNAAEVQRSGYRGNFRTAQIAREYMNDDFGRAITLDDLAAVTGRDRWSLSRDFRHFFGTSPYRYLTMRRLDLARRLMLDGNPLSACAAMAGFADQSHMTRQFAKTYGLPPARWIKIVRNAA